MNYRSVSDLNEDIIKWIPKLPQDIELVVGIPRSGLLVANLLSLHLNVPMTDLYGFLEGRIFSAGNRLSNIDESKYSQTPRKVLVVDDSIGTGGQMKIARGLIEIISVRHHVLYAAVYVGTYEQMNTLDYYFQHLPLPQLFEWNLFHQTMLQNTCVDIDGVLCPDPKQYEDDDGYIYEQFLRTVPAIRIPTYTIGWLVTCRLEKYRDITIEWLKKKSIRYNHLIMMEYTDNQSRQNDAAHSSFKASVYAETGAILFIDSSLKQSVEIAKLTGKYVFCTSINKMVNPSMIGQWTERIREEYYKTQHYPIKRIKNLYHIFRWWCKRLSKR